MCCGINNSWGNKGATASNSAIRSSYANCSFIANNNTILLNRICIRYEKPANDDEHSEESQKAFHEYRLRAILQQKKTEHTPFPNTLE
jgi:hypothetical protein